ncbi:bifunctional diguanylate cyclase/phosphohydrolase [Anaerosolibacter sp.]|uniref:bifunctional diguanylate cyclase/phosphohydrolase n=1 Tax=Anaerosolibacter sp. TaxID=1872527 RepID=UPI0039EE2798
MYYTEEKRRKNIFEVVSVVKLLSLLVCGIAFFSSDIWVTSDSAKIGGFNIITLVLFSSTLLLIYKAWSISLVRDQLNEKIIKKDIIEIAFFIGVFFVLIYLTGNYSSQYKFIYLFTIITATIQFGKKFGVAIAVLCSGIILAIDYLTFPGTMINNYFQSDLVLVGVFILTAWLIGYYVNLEKGYREYLINLANKDELTGLYNHRYFHESIRNHFNMAKKSNKAISLMLIDIDYFKYYNDLYGHTAGDLVLKEIGELLLAKGRDCDIVARYGGEEFTILMPDTDEEEAVLIGEKVREAVQNKYFSGEESLPNGKLTVSVGVSCFPGKSQSIKELINSADDALYRAKFLSKNRVESYVSILDELKNDIEDEHIDLISSIKTLISVINAKDRYTYSHTMRVVMYCQLLGDKLGISDQDKKTLKFGAYLHDIGKIEIPKEVLNKRMKLTDSEWNTIKQHPANGTEIIKSVHSLENIIPLILYHHERYDGSGYPHNLKGENIPFLARVLTVADSFDAMTSNRPYNTSKSIEESIAELERCKGIQFDPLIVDAFVEVLKSNEAQLGL